MNKALPVALFALIGCTLCSRNIGVLEDLVQPEFETVAGMEYKISQDFLEENAAFRLPRYELVSFLSKEANQDEFQVVYLPGLELLVNISKKREGDKVYVKDDVLEKLILAGLRPHMIHNHNNFDLDPGIENIQLYWIAPSLKDLSSYFYMLENMEEPEYSIINEYGLLTIKASKDILEGTNSPYFYKSMVAGLSHIQMTLVDETPESLTDWAENYR
ncbi:hypothetical protein GOV11_05020, partial [Candidatus Woesearchaeota archaeon]|nr:hypothetical protein [Candidatus Woesearchaeota archaeon]